MSILCTGGRSSDKLGRRDGQDHAVAPRHGGTGRCDPVVRSRTAVLMAAPWRRGAQWLALREMPSNGV